MTTATLSSNHKYFYKNLKKSLQNGFTWVTGSTASTTDLVVLDVRKNIQLFKVVTPSDCDKVLIWKEKLNKIYSLAWYKADYVLVYVDQDFQEIKRETYSLN